VAAAYASYYPEPNRSGTESNYFTNQLRPYDYNAFMGRLDHNFSSSNRMFLTSYFNKRAKIGTTGRRTPPTRATTA